MSNDFHCWLEVIDLIIVKGGDLNKLDNTILLIAVSSFGMSLC